jgi:hypothetical protein
LNGVYFSKFLQILMPFGEWAFTSVDKTLHCAAAPPAIRWALLRSPAHQNISGIPLRAFPRENGEPLSLLSAASPKLR